MGWKGQVGVDSTPDAQNDFLYQPWVSSKLKLRFRVGAGAACGKEEWALGYAGNMADMLPKCCQHNSAVVGVTAVVTVAAAVSSIIAADAGADADTAAISAAVIQ